MAKCEGGAWVVTKFPGGVEVHAHPQHGPDDEVRADALGYPHVGAMTLEHDPLHTVVCHVLFNEPSIVLRHLLGLVDPADEVLAAEEQVVLAVQRYLNLVRSRIRQEG